MFAKPIAEQLRGGLMAAAAPHRERRGSAELCCVTATGPEGMAWSCVRGGAGKGGRQRVCTRGQQAQNRLPRPVSMAPSYWSSRSIWTTLPELWFDLRVVLCGAMS